MENKEKFRPEAYLWLMVLVRKVMHYRHYAYGIEQT